MKKVTVTIEYTIQETNPRARDFFEGAKDFEVLNPDGTREAFVDSEQAGIDQINEIYGELYFGPFHVDVSE